MNIKECVEQIKQIPVSELHKYYYHPHIPELIAELERLWRIEERAEEFLFALDEGSLFDALEEKVELKEALAAKEQ